MSCNHPFKAFKTGYKTDNGKDDLILTFDDCENDLLGIEKCKKPIRLDDAPHVVINGKVFLSDPLEIPCGSCVACRMQKAKEWKIRNCLELREYPEAYFVTLTYDDWHLPRLNDGSSVLVKKDFQDFLKRLRKYIGFVRYFACGEYGDLTGRAHFHAILYCHLTDLSLIGVEQYVSGVVSKAWNKGFALIEDVTPGSIAYVSGYVEKKFKADYEKYPVKPFLMMSLKPSIGLTYFLKRFDSFEEDMHVYGNFHQDKTKVSAPVPRAFRRKLQDLPWYEDWKQAALLAGESMAETMKVVYGCADLASLHFAQDAAMNKKLEKLRKEKI